MVMSIWQRQYNLTMPEYKKVIQISNWIIENVLEYLKMPISLSGARTHESILGQKYKNIFVRFLVQMKTLKSPFEIN